MTDKKRPSFDDFKKEAFKQEKFKKEYDKLQPEFDLAIQLLIARRHSKISQSDLAAKLRTKQPAIARFENGGFERSSLLKLQEYVNALGYNLRVELVPKDQEFNDLVN